MRHTSQSNDIIERLINVTHAHSPDDTRQAYREALQGLAGLARAEMGLAVMTDQMQVQQVMSEGWDG